MIMTINFRSFRPILFTFMLGQLPLFYLTRPMRNSKYGNYFFIFGLTLGPALIITIYLRLNVDVIE